MSRSHQVYAEIGTDGGALLFSFDPPGLVGRGASLAEATEQACMHGIAELLSIAAAADCVRAASNRQSPWSIPAETMVASCSAPHSLTIAETVHRRGLVANGNTTATFSRDLEPVSVGEVPAFLELLTESRRRLLAWRAVLETSASATQLLEYRSLPHRKTISEQLIHIANAERWYLVRIHPELPRLPESHTPWERLDVVRSLVVRTLKGMTADQLAAQNAVNGELWSPRKVVRRLMYHEQFHRDTIARDFRLATAQRRN